MREKQTKPLRAIPRAQPSPPKYLVSGTGTGIFFHDIARARLRRSSVEASTMTRLARIDRHLATSSASAFASVLDVVDERRDHRDASMSRDGWATTDDDGSKSAIARCRSWATHMTKETKRDYLALYDANGGAEASWERTRTWCPCSRWLTASDVPGCGTLGSPQSTQGQRRLTSDRGDDTMHTGVLWGVFVLFIVIAGCFIAFLRISKLNPARDWHTHVRSLSCTKQDFDANIEPPRAMHLVQHPGNDAPHFAIAIEENPEE